MKGMDPRTGEGGSPSWPSEIPDAIEANYPLTAGDGLPLKLRRWQVPNGRPVLLLHGASAGSDTFLTPRHGRQSLAAFLVAQGYEPWLLDWRGSKDVDVSPDDLIENGSSPGKSLTFNAAAQHDIGPALDKIFEVRGQNCPSRIDAIGHCMGGAVLAEALLKKRPGVHGRLSHVVLLTIGLFYQMNLQGRLKAESHLLKRMKAECPDQPFLNPRLESRKETDDPCPTRRPLEQAWPSFLETLYRAWPVPYDRERMARENMALEDCSALEMFNRLSFMFGEPYHEANLVPEIHHYVQLFDVEPRLGLALALPEGARVEGRGGMCSGEVTGLLADDYKSGSNGKFSVYRLQGRFQPGQALLVDGQPIGKVGPIVDLIEPQLPELFGRMPLDLFIHGAENLRQGVATDLGAHDGRPRSVFDGEQDPDLYRGYEALDHLTLIGGGVNRLWHRDSLDRMADWLGRHPPLRKRWSKHICLDYGHQDLLWGRHAACDVFPSIVKGLG